jgi:nicotinamidase-related amidase
MLPDPSNTALIVVDMQVGFLRDGASCERVGLPIAALKPSIAPCQALVALARSRDIPIIFTRYVYRADFRDGGLLAGELIPALREHKALVSGSEDAQIVSELTPQPGDYVLDKNRPSAFYATPLETWLSGLNVENLVVCGVTTNCCVESTVRDASHRDYRAFVVRDAVAEFDEDRNRVALESIAMLFGYVTTLKDIQQHWSRA